MTGGYTYDETEPQSQSYHTSPGASPDDLGSVVAPFHKVLLSQFAEQTSPILSPNDTEEVTSSHVSVGIQDALNC